MSYLNNLPDNVIIICPSHLKDSLVKSLLQLDKFKHVKLFSKSEILEGAYFTYDLEAIYYLNKKYGYNYSLAQEILSNLHGIMPETKKLSKLFDIYNDLTEQKLLKFNPYFKNLFINKTTFIIGYSEKDQELKQALNMLGVSFSFLKIDEKTVYNHEVYMFDEMKDEVTYVVNKICDLYLQGVSLNNIYIYNFPSEYENILKKSFYYHNIMFEDNKKIKLYSSPIYLKFIDKLKDHSLNDAYNILKDEVKYDPFDALGSIVDVIVEVNNLNLPKEEELNVLTYLASKKSLKTIHYQESIKTITKTSLIKDDDYVFMLGFSLGSYPYINKDTDFYLDIEKELLNKNTSIVLNEIETEELKSFILHTKNIFITYKKHLYKTVYYPSLLIEELKLPLIKGNLSNKRYSKSLSKMEVASYIDQYNLYGTKNKWQNSYSLDELKYNSFDHLFKGIKYFDNTLPLTLSYSQINEYNKCPFAYFVSRILKASTFTGNFDTNLGTLYHKILEESVTKEINLEDYQEEINKTFKTAKERFFVNKLLPQVKDVIKKNQDFLNNSMFTKEIAEKSIRYEIDSNNALIGRIDKILLDEVGANLIVIDYKTGSFKFVKEKCEYGIDMQLPIYSLLLQKEYQGFTNCGMYIQNVCLKDVDKEKDDSYTLDGITLNDKEKVKRLDLNFESEEVDKPKYISKLRLTKTNELSPKSKLIEKEDLDKLTLLAKKEVLKAFSNIRNGIFNIAPVHFEGEQKHVCDYCEYQDICFKTSSDIRHIKIEKEKDKKESEE